MLDGKVVMWRFSQQQKFLKYPFFLRKEKLKLIKLKQKYINNKNQKKKNKKQNKTKNKINK
jgi:hypothetical protein